MYNTEFLLQHTCKTKTKEVPLLSAEVTKANPGDATEQGWSSNLREVMEYVSVPSESVSS